MQCRAEHKGHPYWELSVVRIVHHTKSPSYEQSKVLIVCKACLSYNISFVQFNWLLQEQHRVRIVHCAKANGGDGETFWWRIVRRANRPVGKSSGGGAKRPGGELAKWPKVQKSAKTGVRLRFRYKSNVMHITVQHGLVSASMEKSGIILIFTMVNRTSLYNLYSCNYIIKYLF